jgi:hypothetical protein
MPRFTIIPEHELSPARLASPATSDKIAADTPALAVEAWARRVYERAEHEGAPSPVTSGVYCAVPFGAGVEDAVRVLLSMEVTFMAEPAVMGW